MTWSQLRPQAVRTWVGAVPFALLIAASPVTASASDYSFQVLSGTGGASDFARALAISRNGEVIVGEATGFGAVRWDNGVPSGLGVIDGAGSGRVAQGVSADGAVIVGNTNSTFGIQAFRWENGVISGLGDLEGGESESYANAVSADGSIVVGRGVSAAGTEAFRWENNVMTGLGELAGGGFLSRANGISGDGNIISGYSESNFFREPFRWENNVMVGLGFYARTTEISADGQFIVGPTEIGGEGYRWGNGETTLLGTMAGARGVSPDGAVIATQLGEIWIEGIGALDLADLLLQNGVIVNMTLDSANAVTYAGGITIIVGFGTPFAGGERQGWRATIPAPFPIDGDANGDGQSQAAEYTVWANNFGIPFGTATKSQGDYDRNGFVGPEDYTIWANTYGPTSVGPAAIPEPSSLALLVIGMLGFGALYRRRIQP